MQTEVNAKGRMRVKDGETKFNFRLTGLDESKGPWIMTAWLIYKQEGLPAFASHKLPLSDPEKGFCNGMCIEPNEFKRVERDGKSPVWKLSTSVPFDVRQAGGPLVSKQVLNQDEFTAGSIAEHHENVNGNLVPLGGDFLREFDETTGYQKLDSDGRPILVRSDNAAVSVLIVVHDGMSLFQLHLFSGLAPNAVFIADNLAHGVLPGLKGEDHFQVVGFAIPEMMEM